jgi:hypothetical protein
VRWTDQKDHDKWVYDLRLYAGSEYACFGGLDRMDSQCKRGGELFSLSDNGLAVSPKSSHGLRCVPEFFVK